ncbi:MAG: OmpA family protein [Chitinophagales bacterium]|nr:OmpA family protein [Chitinophagales bacterium]
MKIKFVLVSFIALAMITQSCVSVKKYDEQAALSERYKVQKDLCKSDLAEERLINRSLTAENEKLNRYNKALVKDTIRLFSELTTSSNEIANLNVQLAQSISQNKALAANSAKEMRELNEKLSEKESELQLKQEALSTLEANLNEKASKIDALNKDLSLREKKLVELEEMLKKKDQAAAQLKANITKALTGISSDDLTVKLKDGRIYVSMSENLLFKSGSAKVDPKGKEALIRLAAALQNETDLKVVVEGHTDNVPFFSSGGDIKDNWDLSVMRATSVVKILTTGGHAIDPYRVVASGRSEYFPIDKNETAQGRSNNRRTEIILSPDIQAVFDILESN